MKDTKEKQTELTDEQLWELCCLEEEKKKIILNDSRDKGIDWDYEEAIWNKWNPKDLK